jgi:hypothetical protein
MPVEIDIPLDTNVNPSVSQELHIDHVGYIASAPKRAVVEADGALQTFQIVRESDQKVRLAGELAEVPSFTAWGDSSYFYVADFSDLEEAGTFSLYVNGEFSESFELSEHLYFDKTFDSVLGYFESSRADDTAVWNADQAVRFQGSNTTHDVRGGWYDASGDISKYLSHLSYANYLNPQQIPLVAWSLAWVADEGDALLAEKGLQSAVQEEALWGADYLLRVLDPAGYFYIDVFDGWTGDLGERRICSFEGDGGVRTTEWQSAFREGGGMSIAALARIARWNVMGSFSSNEYLAGAKAAFAHLQSSSASYTDNGIENVIDDYTALLAASELFATTNDAAYLTAARSRATSLIGRLGAEGYFIADGASRPFWHASDAGLPVVALARYAELETQAGSKTAALDAIKKHLSYLVSVTEGAPNPYGYARQHFRSQATVQSGFFIPHDNESGYWWQGENARLASLAAASLIGGRAAGVSPNGPLGVSKDLAAYALDQLHWILGKNPYDISFLTGTGRNNPPAYCGSKPPYHGTLPGGISNGITGSETNGTGIKWLSGAPSEECWQDWRWSEQWIPHSAWYMLAITAASL